MVLAHSMATHPFSRGTDLVTLNNSLRSIGGNEKQRGSKNLINGRRSDSSVLMSDAIGYEAAFTTILFHERG